MTSSLANSTMGQVTKQTKTYTNPQINLEKNGTRSLHEEYVHLHINAAEWCQKFIFPLLLEKGSFTHHLHYFSSSEKVRCHKVIHKMTQLKK